MNVIVKPVPVGDMAGALAYFVTSDGDLAMEQILAAIKDNVLPQPHLVIFDGRELASDLISDMARELQSTHTTVLITTINEVTPVWYAVNRVVLVGTISDYTGLSANEVHLHWLPPTSNYPIVAPLAAANVHMYCTTKKGNFTELTEWVRKAPYTIGVIPRTL